MESQDGSIELDPFLKLIRDIAVGCEFDPNPAAEKNETAMHIFQGIATSNTIFSDGSADYFMRNDFANP